MKLRVPLLGGTAVLAAMLTPESIEASSHREAPFVAKNPKIDGTDFYIFNSYETGRAGYVTILANYSPLQDSYGGPNYFTFDPEAIYEIHIDNDGNQVEDITFQFKFSNALAQGADGKPGLTLDIGAGGAKKAISVPFGYLGPIKDSPDANQNVLETYKINVIRGNRRTGTSMPVTELGSGSATFRKPFDNVGAKTIGTINPANDEPVSRYAAYADTFIKDIDIPGCTPSGVAANTHPRVFVGQRAEGFAVNLGQVFDLVNFRAGPNPKDALDPRADVVGLADQANKNIVADKNISTIALEIPANCLNAAGKTKIGAWTTSSVRQARVINPTASFAQPAREGGPFVQVSRLGLPLVNEIVIGLRDKDRFNGSEPKDDVTNWVDYVTNPTLPHVLELLFGAVGVREPTAIPRADLQKVFAIGVAGVNDNGAVCEYVRLNTAIAATASATQNPLGALGCFDDPTATTDAVLNTGLADCDPAGFPNGRRPIDDVVDIEIRVAMGALLKRADAMTGGCLHATSTGCLPYVDGARLPATAFLTKFPYLNTPFPGSP
jgi:uncharacterized protein DUF4331